MHTVNLANLASGQLTARHAFPHSLISSGQPVLALEQWQRDRYLELVG